MNVSLRWKIARIVITSVYLYAGWLAFTVNVSPMSLIIGAVFCLGVATMTYGIFIEEREAGRRFHLPRLYYAVFYFLFLILQIYLSSFKVAWKVITGNINPRIVHFRTRLKYDLARALLANSITLTPGTVTLDLDDDHLIVHWLDARTTHSHYASKLIKGRLEQWLRRIWI